jgi:hypothetical protein
VEKSYQPQFFPPKGGRLPSALAAAAGEEALGCGDGDGAVTPGQHAVDGAMEARVKHRLVVPTLPTPEERLPTDESRGERHDW